MADIQQTVILYFDNSNVFINAGQYEAKKYKFCVPSDPRCRIDVGRLVDLACDGRRALRAKLYGSEPPALDTVWKAIRNKFIEVDHFRRSTWNNREKETDAALTADAVDDLIELKEQAGVTRALILFSGDKDMLPVLRKAIKHGWAIEIWSFKTALAGELLAFKKSYVDWVQVYYIDEYFEKVSFTERRWDISRFRIPADRTMVLRFDACKLESGTKPGGTLRDTLDRALTRVVDASSRVFKVPTMGCWQDLDPAELKAVNNATSGRKAPPRRTVYLLALICVPPENKDGKQIYDFTQLFKGKDDMQKHFSDMGCFRIQTFLQFRESAEEERTAIYSPANTANASMIRNSNPRENTNSRPPPPPNVPQMAPRQPVPQQFVPPQSVHPQSIPPHLIPQPFVEQDLEQLEDAISEFGAQELSWTVVAPKLHKPPQRYSDKCSHGFRCLRGMGCRYFHTAEQKEFFKEQPDTRNRKYYKTKSCFHGPRCNYSSRTHLCPYAHDLSEANCGFCYEHGKHWMDECPARKG